MTASRPLKLSLLLLCAAMAGFMAATCLTASAQPEAEAETRHVIRLRYQPKGMRLTEISSLEGREPAFEEEPQYKNPEIIRGVFPAGRGPEGLVGFAYDKQAGELYVDLNRDRRLSGAPEGPILRNDRFHLRSPHGSLEIPYEVMLVIIEPQPDFSEWRYGTHVWSGWVGQITLRGRQWHVAVEDNMDAVLDGKDILVFKPPFEGAPKLKLDLYEDPWRLPLPKRLFVDGQLYGMDYVFEGVGRRIDLVVTMTELACSLGEVRFTGEFVQHLLLQGGDVDDISLAVIEEPGETFRVPVGDYDRQRAYVYDDPKYGVFAAERPVPMHVRKETDMPLAMGAPLRSRVEATRRGRTLELNFLLEGQSGEAYYPPGGSELGRAMFREQAPHPELMPKFAIYHGDSKIASSDFEYG